MKANPSKRAKPPGMVRMLGWSRLLLIPPIVGAFVLMWWSVQRLAPVLAEVKQASEEITRLSLEMDAMQGRLQEEGGAEEIEQGFTRAHSLLLPGRAGVEGWLRELQAAAIPMGLDLAITFGAPSTRNLTNHVVTVIPASLGVRIRQDAQDKGTPYRRLIDLTQYLSRTPHRVDLVFLSVQGGADSIDSAQLTVHLWSTDLQREAP